MSYELLVGRKTPGDTLNLTRCTTQAVWTTQRTGQPGQNSPSPICALRPPKIEEGDVVRFSVDGQLQLLRLGLYPRLRPLGSGGRGLL